MTKAGIADLEQGRRKPSWETVLALAKALGVTPDAFLKPPAERGPARPGVPEA
jgi:transcriptional regulator with XRE-family HTH domain